MRTLDKSSRDAVARVIADNAEALAAIDGFVSAEPGFPIIDGRIIRQAAILVFVDHKKPPGHLDPKDFAPRQLGAYRVCVMQADPYRQLAAKTDFQLLSDRMSEASMGELTYEPLAGNPIDQPFRLEKPILCHVGPDAGWPTLKPFLEATQHTLSVAMYDFNADYIAATFINTIKDHDIQAILTWDDGMTAPETTIRGKLKTELRENLDGWIIKCGSGYRFASAYHEKVAVRDSTAFWLSSGNWSTRSQPDIDPIANPASAKGMYSKGNREWHVIVEDEALAQLFERYIAYDRDGSKQDAADGDHKVVLDRQDIERLPDLFVPVETVIGGFELAAAVAEPVEPKILPSQPRPITVQPVLTPDNYLARINALLQSAQRSIYLQFSYVTFSAAPKDEPFRDMLAILADLSYRPGMDLRIIVGSAGASDKIRKLAENGFNEAVFRIQGNVHNKGIIVDGKTVLVSSTNWSSDGVLRNRDAGLIIDDDEIARYYQDVFLDDWNNRGRTTLDNDPPVLIAAEGMPAPAGMVRISWRDYFD